MPYRLLLLVSVVTLLPSRPADAGTVLKWSEETNRKGKTTHSVTTMHSGPLGLRATVVETGTKDKTREITFLYLRESKTLHVQESGATEKVAINRQLLARLWDKVHQAGKSTDMTPVSPKPLHSRHVVNGIECEGYSFPQKGRRVRFVCFAPPSALGVDEMTVRNLQEMGELMAGFGILVKRLEASADNEREPINTFGLPQGFPVREWEPGENAMVVDSQLVSVSSQDVPASLFVVTP